jgi:hypothetical protein
VASIDVELANDSDSEEDCVPEISSSEESHDENNISDLGSGFCKKKIANQIFHSPQEIQQYNLLFKMEQI